jgi:hypothetical protein
MSPLLTDIATIRRAMVGDDLRGGMVKDVADMKSEMKAANGVSKEEKRQKESALKLTEKRKWAIIALVFSIIGYVGPEAVKYLVNR